MNILNMVFFLAIGLLYLGVTFQYQEFLIGLSAVVIGAVHLASLLSKA
jgi:hypothetical protein